MAKEALYREFMARMKAADEAGNYLEASWYAYAILEDRLRSLLRSSGGEGKGKVAGGKPIRMMGPKLEELKWRAKSDSLLAANLDYTGIKKWKEDRNDLTHAMADASLTLAQIDAAAKKLAQDGAELVRTVSAACRRVKTHRDKVAA